MGDFLFGGSTGKVSKTRAAKLDRIARRHGARFIAADMPEGARSWFSCPNVGAPFDADVARAVLSDVKREGV